MVDKAWLGTALLLAGCAPRVILSDEGAGGTSDGTDTMESSGDHDSAPVTTQPPTSVGPMGTGGPVTATFGSESGFDTSGSFGSSSSGGEPMQCWSIVPLFLAPEESRLFVRDQDGDGLAELWLSFFEGGGPGGGSDLFWFDNLGQPNPGGFFPGFLTGLHNLQGDFVLDGVGFAFGGGGPPSLGFVEGMPLMIEGPPTSTPFGFQDGFEGFYDVTGDAIDDFLINRDGMLELHEGDGSGGFTLLLTGPTLIVGDLAPRPIDGDSSVMAAAQSSFFDELGGCVEHPFELLSFSDDAIDSVGLSAQSDSFVPNEIIGAEYFGAFTNVYARACSDNEVTVQVQRFEGGTLSQVDDYDPSSFAAFGDFDGNGYKDIGLGGPTLDTIQTYNGSAAGTFTDGVFDELVFSEPVPSRVFIVDIDADGRDEIILGTRELGTEINYQRLDLEPC